MRARSAGLPRRLRRCPLRRALPDLPAGRAHLHARALRRRGLVRSGPALLRASGHLRGVALRRAVPALRRAELPAAAAAGRAGLRWARRVCPSGGAGLPVADVRPGALRSALRSLRRRSCVPAFPAGGVRVRWARGMRAHAGAAVRRRVQRAALRGALRSVRGDAGVSASAAALLLRHGRRVRRRGCHVQLSVGSLAHA